MSLIENKHAQQVLKGSTIFICGEHEHFDKLFFQKLLILKLEEPIEHLYFVNPNDEIIKILRKETNSTNFSIVNNIYEIKDLKKFNILACGFKGDSKELYKVAKNSRNHVLLFFNTLGIFKNTWEKLGNKIYFEEKKFSSIMLEKYAPKPFYDEPLHKSQWNEKSFFFTNRGHELNQFRKFKADNEKRCCKISGPNGIGKRTFVRKMKISGLSNAISHYCIDENDDLSYILKPILGKLNIQFKNSEIPLSLNYYKVDPILKKLFSTFDKRDNANLIFYNVHILYNEDKKKFHDKNIAIFFKHLLQRRTYKGNKIYFISEYDLVLPSVNLQLIHNIRLSTMTAEYIKYILEHEFGKPERDSSAYATEIMLFDDSIINKIIGGYPPIAYIFVDVCSEYSMSEVIQKGFAYSIFKEKKIDELKQYIILKDHEVDLLSYLSLFRKNFSENAVNYFSPNAIIVMENLVRRLFIQNERYEKHTTYYIPSYIKDYVQAITSHDTNKTNHDKIGDFYWKIADTEEIYANEQLENYRLALFHYERAGNSIKQRLLMQRFEGVFLNKAYKLYSANKLNDAFILYETLYKENSLNDSVHLNAFLICNVKLNKPRTKELFDEVIQVFPKNTFLKITYADYLFRKLKYDKAEKFCLEVKKISSKNYNSYVVENLYAKILAAKGEEDRAFKILQDKINQIQNTKKLEKKEKNTLITFRMTYYSLLNCYSLLKRIKQQTISWLREDEVLRNDILTFLKQPINKNAEKIIIEFFEKAIKYETNNYLLYNSYYNILIRQGYKDKANQIFANRPPKRIQYKYDKKHGFKKNDLTSEIDLEEQVTFHKLEIQEQVISHKSEIQEQVISHKSEIQEQIISHKSEIQEQVISHKSEIYQIFELFEEKSNLADQQLEAVLKLEKDNYRALYSKCNLLILIEDYKILKNEVEMSYNKEGKMKLSNRKDGIKSSVFISYNHKDQLVAKKLVGMLKDAGLEVKIDFESIRAGENINAFIEKNIRETNVTLSIVSENSLLSAWVAKESIDSLYHEKTSSKKFIVCYLDETFFKHRFRLDATKVIDSKIKEIDDLIPQYIKKNIDTNDLNSSKSRLYALRNNLGDILYRLRECLCIDISGENFDKGIAKILKDIKS